MAMNESPKKEWIGESGYGNCLMTAMCRIPIPRIELFSNQPAPNLEMLTVSRLDTQEWIQAQEFDYSTLSAAEIIRLLATTADIPELVSGKLSKSISAYLAEKNEPPVKYIFLLDLVASSGVQH